VQTVDTICADCRHYYAIGHWTPSDTPIIAQIVDTIIAQIVDIGTAQNVDPFIWFMTWDIWGKSAFITHLCTFYTLALAGRRWWCLAGRH
jgi:hypothetical protein